MQDLNPSEIEAILKGIGHQETESTFSSKSVYSDRESDRAEQKNISRLQFTQLKEEESSDQPFHLKENLKEIKVQVDVVLGRSKISLNDLLMLKENQTISLDKLAGEPVEIEINGNLIAYGEVVVVDEHFGVHITQMVAGTN
jgi:flagellar motor switch protein FliN